MMSEADSAWDHIKAGLTMLASLTDCLDVPGLALRLVAHHGPAAGQQPPGLLLHLLAAVLPRDLGAALFSIQSTLQLNCFINSFCLWVDICKPILPE